jgi:hypothetical protein
MATPDFFEENCENCGFLAGDDVCGNPRSVYHLRPMVYRDGDEVLQTGWCDLWAPAGAVTRPEPPLTNGRQL